MYAVYINDVWFRYEDNIEWTLYDIDMNLKLGTSVGLVGPTGSGKTTLAKIIKGLLKPTRGEVYILGKKIDDYSSIELAKTVGYLFQNPTHQIFSLTVYDEIAFGPRNIGMENIEDRVNKIAEKFGLSDKLSLSPFNLSTGEKERIAIASVLVMEPEILILDEPTLGQDYKNYNIIKQVIYELKKEGKTTVLISHEIDLINSCVDEIIALKNGKIMFLGNKRDFLKNEDILEELGFLDKNFNLVLG